MTAKRKTMEIIFIVSGEDVPVWVGLTESLSVGREKALLKSHNSGRPPEEWEIRDERGVMLPTEPKVDSFGFEGVPRLFLTLKAGFGGVEAGLGWGGLR